MGGTSWLGGVAGAATAATLVIGLVGGAKHRPVPTPWLLVLVRVNAGRPGSTLDALHVVRAVDVVLLLLSAATYAGFWPGPGSPAVGWMGLAVAQPVLGVVLLLLTRLSGRSALMGGGLVLAVLMVVDGRWAAGGWLGAGACVLLLIGDLGTTGRPSRVRTAALVVGYAGLVAWLGVLAAVLLA